MLEETISTLPKGKLLCCKNGKYYKWYISDGKKSCFLRSCNRELACQLAYKDYCIHEAEDIVQRIDVLKKCLVELNSIEETDYFLNKNPEQEKLLKEYLQNCDVQSTEWMGEEYECSKNYPEHLIHKTLKGHMVRSKSEVIIANTLYLNKIPYRYECGLYLDGVQYYPDFTIYRAADKQIIYWEHFGMMDVPVYCEKAYNKLKVYGTHGMIPTINMITTFETQDCPIDSEKIQQLIDEYLY